MYTALLFQEVDFADSLLAHAGFPEKKMARMRKRVKKGFKDEEKRGIAFKDFMVNLLGVRPAFRDTKLK